jgi:hypothetical protein
MKSLDESSLHPLGKNPEKHRLPTGIESKPPACRQEFFDLTIKTGKNS